MNISGETKRDIIRLLAAQPVHTILHLPNRKLTASVSSTDWRSFAWLINGDVNLREQLYHARSTAHAYNVPHAVEAEDVNHFLEDEKARAGITKIRSRSGVQLHQHSNRY